MCKKILTAVLFLMICVGCNSSQSLENKVIAHRGAWKPYDLPQNSIASLEKAIELGCGGSELDIWMTRDSVLVINHDADHNGLQIGTTDYEDLVSIKLKNGEKLPTLEEYIKAGLDQNKTKLILEVKPSKISEERDLILAEKTVETVRNLGAQDLVEYISFSYPACKKIAELDKNAMVSFLDFKINKTPEEIKADGITGVDYHRDAFKENPDYIQKAKELGLITNVWTVNEVEDMKWFLEQDIDYITTDEPELLLELL